jgi:hypothetical protein
MVHKKGKPCIGSGVKGNGTHVRRQGLSNFNNSMLHFFFQLYMQINKLPRERVECKLTFAGFLVFHCPLKADAVETLRMLADSSHRVRLMFINFQYYD